MRSYAAKGNEDQAGQDGTSEVAPVPRLGARGAEEQCEVMTAEQVAAMLGVNRKTVFEGAGRGEIPHARIGRRLLFSREALLAWLACGKGGSSSEGNR